MCPDGYSAKYIKSYYGSISYGTGIDSASPVSIGGKSYIKGIWVCVEPYNEDKGGYPCYTYGCIPNCEKRSTKGLIYDEDKNICRCPDGKVVVDGVCVSVENKDNCIEKEQMNKNILIVELLGSMSCNIDSIDNECKRINSKYKGGYFQKCNSENTFGCDAYCYISLNPLERKLEECKEKEYDISKKANIVSEEICNQNIECSNPLKMDYRQYRDTEKNKCIVCKRCYLPQDENITDDNNTIEIRGKGDKDNCSYPLYSENEKYILYGIYGDKETCQSIIDGIFNGMGYSYKKEGCDIACYVTNKKQNITYYIDDDNTTKQKTIILSEEASNQLDKIREQREKEEAQRNAREAMEANTKINKGILSEVKKINEKLDEFKNIEVEVKGSKENEIEQYYNGILNSQGGSIIDNILAVGSGSVSPPQSIPTNGNCDKKIHIELLEKSYEIDISPMFDEELERYIRIFLKASAVVGALLLAF